MASNRLLCSTEIAPDGCVLAVEDAWLVGISGSYVHEHFDYAVDVVHDALWVHTMSIHDCDVVGRLVRVQVLAGSDLSELGVLVFDGWLSVSSGVLAVGHRQNPQRHLIFGLPSVVHVSVFDGSDKDAIWFDDSGVGYPISGPSQLNVLLHGELDFARAVASSQAREPRIIQPFQQGTAHYCVRSVQ